VQVRTILRSGAQNLTPRRHYRLAETIAAGHRSQCAQRVPDVYDAADPATGRRLAEKVLAGFGSCPIPEIARLGRTLKQWADALPGYLRTAGTINGGAGAVTARLSRAAASPQASGTARSIGYACSLSLEASSSPNSSLKSR